MRWHARSLLLFVLRFLFVALPLWPTSALAQLNCTIVLGLADDVALNDLAWETDYSDTPGVFVSDFNGGPAECESVNGDAWIVSSSDHWTEETLVIEMHQGSSEIFGPTNLVSCAFLSASTPTKQQFKIDVYSATDLNDEELLPLPDVEVASIQCSAMPDCGNGNKESGEECDDGNAVNTDTCLVSCKAAKCGDGFVRAETESCDDGNTADGDGCSSACEIEQGASGGQCDPNDDGKISTSDALVILRAAVGLSTALAQCAE